MFDTLAVIDTDADEATLVEGIAELEHLKSVAAAGQVRLTAALDAKRRAREAAAGVPRPSGVVVLPVRSRWPVMIRRTGVGVIWVLPARWCTRCRTRWLRWRPGRYRSGGPP